MFIIRSSASARMVPFEPNATTLTANGLICYRSFFFLIPYFNYKANTEEPVDSRVMGKRQTGVVTTTTASLQLTITFFRFAAAAIFCEMATWSRKQQN